MNKDDMMKMFGLAEKPAVKASDSPAQTEWLPDGEVAEPNPVAMKGLDEWDVSRGVKLYKEHPDLDLETADWADFHAAAYLLDPELDESCTDASKAGFLKDLMESPEYQALRESTMLCTVPSAIAAESFGKEYHKLLESEKKRKKQKDPEKEARKQEVEVLKAAGRAAKAATEEVEQFEETCHAVGMGAGTAGSPLNPAKVAAVYNRVRNTAMLRRICELAGRYRRTAQAKQRQKVVHGYDDMVGVELSGDIGRVLPEELAKLADPDFELDVMRRLVERQVISREYRGVEKVGKGPIVVVVDESGSMAGEPVCNAKAFALGMAWVARHQNRYCALIGYSGSEGGNVLVLPPGRWDESGLMDWLCHFYGHGSHQDVPINTLPFELWDRVKAPKGKTDLILITDASCHFSKEEQDNFNDWKGREKVKCLSLVINNNGESLKNVSDEVFQVSSISLQEEAVERCLSV